MITTVTVFSWICVLNEQRLLIYFIRFLRNFSSYQILTQHSKRQSLHTSQVAGVCPGFRSTKRLGVFLLPPGWDASPSQGYTQH